MEPGQCSPLLVFPSSADHVGPSVCPCFWFSSPGQQWPSEDPAGRSHGHAEGRAEQQATSRGGRALHIHRRHPAQGRGTATEAHWAVDLTSTLGDEARLLQDVGAGLIYVQRPKQRHAEKRWPLSRATASPRPGPAGARQVGTKGMAFPRPAATHGGELEVHLVARQSPWWMGSGHPLTQPRETATQPPTKTYLSQK